MSCALRSAVFLGAGVATAGFNFFEPHRASSPHQATGLSDPFLDAFGGDEATTANAERLQLPGPNHSIDRRSADRLFIAAERLPRIGDA